MGGIIGRVVVTRVEHLDASLELVGSETISPRGRIP